MAYQYEEPMSVTVSAGYIDTKSVEIRNTPRVHEEIELLHKATVELRDVVSQIQERLGAVLRPSPLVNHAGSDQTMPDRPAEESMCQVAAGVRNCREMLDETRRKVRFLMSALEI
jgi:hypothetical protein